jgi:hypothetical protein
VTSTKAETFDLPALSYGLFHAQVRPNKLYGIVTTGITLQGLNMDIGHLRHMRWVKDDNPSSTINNKPELTANGKSAAQNRWITYNRMRGQYASTMEHAVPEQFWIDKNSCSYIDETGQIKNPTLDSCTEGISAVKAIAIAQREGQKIYTITKQNATTALATLPVGGDMGAEIRSAVQSGKEVIVHERAITAYGWTGYGYIIVDPDTGAGSYLIEGNGHGGIILFVAGWLIGYLSTMIGFTGIGIPIALAGVTLSLAMIAAGMALISGNSGLCKDILMTATSVFVAAIAGVAMAATLLAGFGIALVAEEGILIDAAATMFGGLSVARGDRFIPLFSICGSN